MDARQMAVGQALALFEPQDLRKIVVHRDAKVALHELGNNLATIVNTAGHDFDMLASSLRRVPGAPRSPRLVYE